MKVSSKTPGSVDATGPVADVVVPVDTALLVKPVETVPLVDPVDAPLLGVLELVDAAD